MEEYYGAFEIISASHRYSRGDYMEAFVREDDEGNTYYHGLDRVCFPWDYLSFVEREGVSDLKLGPLEISFADPSILYGYVMDYSDYNPSAFLIAQTSRGELYAYTRGDLGTGLYRMSTASVEPEGEFLAPTFTDLFIRGEGVDKLLEC